MQTTILNNEKKIRGKVKKNGGGGGGGSGGGEIFFPFCCGLFVGKDRAKSYRFDALVFQQIEFPTRSRFVSFFSIDESETETKIEKKIKNERKKERE